MVITNRLQCEIIHNIFKIESWRPVAINPKIEPINVKGGAYVN